VLQTAYYKTNPTYTRARLQTTRKPKTNINISRLSPNECMYTVLQLKENGCK